MSGFCGWWGGSDTEEAATGRLRRMADALRVHDAFVMESAVCGGAGLARVGPPARSRVHAHGGVIATIVGAPSWRRRAWRDRATQHGDAHALARAFLERGAALLDDLADDFALAVMDTRSGELLVATDRMGTMPVYHAVDRGRMIVGTSLRAVLRGLSARPSIDPQALHDYFVFSGVPSPESGLRGVRALRPAQVLRHGREGSSSAVYWQPDFRVRGAARGATHAELRGVLEASVARCAGLGGDGVFLSGGLDSTTILGLMTRVTGAPVRAYSLGFAGAATSELPYARLAARAFGARHRECILDASALAGAMEAVSAAFGSPCANVSAPALLTVARAALADGVGTMIAGDGGDELFAGNLSYALQRTLGRWERLPHPVRRAIATTVARPWATRVPAMRRARGYMRRASMPLPERLLNWTPTFETGAGALLSPELLDVVDRNAPLRMLHETYDEVRSASPLDRQLVTDWRFILHGNDLPRMRGACALAGQNVLLPMLSDEVVELSTRIPASHKLGRGLRVFFKQAFGELLPEETLRKRKQGEGIPLAHWMATEPALRELIADSLVSLRRRGLANPDTLDALLRRPLLADPRIPASLVYAMAMLEGWLQHQVDAPAA